MLFQVLLHFRFNSGGNIGPVISALLRALDTSGTIACPAFPDNGRTVYQGHLFVFEKLLSESGMQNHPLNPMTDSNLVRWLQLQSQDTVDLVPLPVVAAGMDAVRDALGLADENRRVFIVDAITNEHLRTIGTAVVRMPLVTGGSGVALGLPNAYRAAGLLPAEWAVTKLPKVDGKQVILAGSCSSMTLKQIAYMKERCPSCQLLVEDVLKNENLVDEVLQWAQPLLDKGPVLIYSSSDPDSVKAAQAAGGALEIGLKFENALARIAENLVACGVRRLVVAGGETSGAVVSALKVPGIRIGPQIAPGVPWVESLGETPLALALKSGNFGDEAFFEKALNMLS